MNRIRSHGNLLSFVVSAMLTSAFLATAPEGIIHAGTVPIPAQAMSTLLSNVQGSGWHGTSTMMVAVPSATPNAVAVNVPPAPASPLRDAQLIKIISAVDKSEDVRALSPAMAVLLGLPTNPQNTFKFHFFVTPEGTSHVFARLNASNDYLVYSRTGSVGTFMHVDAGLQLYAAATETVGVAGATLKVLPVREAAKQLDQELAAWANYADNTLAKANETAQN